MELFSVSIKGFRRFRDLTTLRTNGKLVAILGPNEAGKSTLLRALEHLSHNVAFSASDISRGGIESDLEIVGRFLLNDEELAEAQLDGPRWMTIEKGFNGTRYYGFQPSVPNRDTSHRESSRAAVMASLDWVSFDGKLRAVDEGLPEKIQDLFNQVREGEETLPKRLIQDLRATLEQAQQAASGMRNVSVRTAVEHWKALVQKEAAPTPLRRGIDALYNLAPDFLMFDEEARALASAYSVGDLRSGIPTPLGSLAAIADLNFQNFFVAVDAGNGAQITTLEHRANRRLRQAFSETWRQSGVAVAFRLSPSAVEIQVENEESEFTGFDERSDGLRQFIALQAFAMSNRSKAPILLIDEAEARLHYDAQADLVQMLARQRVAPKVIYTTHSAGCLSEDLGNGVRLVQQCGNESAWSEIHNKFWADSGNGFAPLLIGMGASTLAFFPTRRAVLVEGPVDMLLYPILFREAGDRDVLGFQFVPGLSVAAQVLAPLIPGAAAQIGYLTDADPGGTEIRTKLTDGGVDPSRIVIMTNSDGSAIELEDFIEPGLLLQAANNLLSTFHSGVPLIDKTELNLSQRMASLEEVYEERAGNPLPKVELAYGILDLLEEAPGRALVDPRRKSAVLKVLEKLEALFTQAK